MLWHANFHKLVNRISTEKWRTRSRVRRGQSRTDLARS